MGNEEEEDKEGVPPQPQQATPSSSSGTAPSSTAPRDTQQQQAVATATAPRVHLALHTAAASGPRKRRRKESNTNALSSSSSSSSEDDEEEEDDGAPQRGAATAEGWRVKLYRLNADGSWDDCGTGRIVCRYTHHNNNHSATTSTNESSTPSAAAPQPQPESEAALLRQLGEPTLVLQAEATTQRVLLRTRILLRDAYQRQGDNIITWSEPYFGDAKAPAQGVDLALSFQDNAGCLEIWRQITHVQSRAAEWFRRRAASQQQQHEAATATPTAPTDNPSATNNNNNTTNNNGPVTAENMAHAVAAAHHATLQRQQQHAMWVHVANEQKNQQAAAAAEQQEFSHHAPHPDAEAEAVAVNMAAAAALAYGRDVPQLPNPPTLNNLEEVADTIAGAQQPQQRESLAMFISKSDCSYLKSLLSLFPSAEARGDYGALATLAACIKTILLLNDPSIIDWIVSEETIFVQVCSALEYDPDLRDKANHRWFLRERAKFRTVVLMEDTELIATIHRAFRVMYLRDTLLRPTMDESSLSTLSSLQIFTHADVVKGVTTSSQPTKSNQDTPGDSYLVKVMRMLGREVREIAKMEWTAMEENPASTLDEAEKETPESTVVVEPSSTTWKQYLAPQGGSLVARRIRRRGCLSFFRELFNMVRISLQQSDKDDFYAAIVGMEVDMVETNVAQGEQQKEQHDSVNILSLLGTVLSDPRADIAEKGAALEIIAAIAMHDPSHVRLHSLEFHEGWKRQKDSGIGGEMTGPGRPKPNERKQIIFHCSPNDLLASLLFLLAVETDAGLLLQTSEIMRIILDTDMVGEHAPMGTGLGAEEADGVPPGMHSPGAEHNSSPQTGASSRGSDQNQFLAMFYEHYVQWLVAPFQFTILHTARQVPMSVLFSPSESVLMQKVMDTLKGGVGPGDPLLRVVPVCATRSSFAVELLSFCVRAHLYSMKRFLLRSRVLGSVLKMLAPVKTPSISSGDRCLKLSALRFLRSILSVKDEFYHRHIIQHNLFAPVFEAFRANPVGDNLVSSAIVEMCDFIHNQNIKSLIEYIVTKHLSVPAANPGSEQPVPSLEDVATPYVTTLTKLRKEYEEDLKKEVSGPEQNGDGESQGSGGPYYPAAPRVVLSEKALEDQRKFRQADEEESYFDCDDDDNEGSRSPKSPITAPAAVDEVAARGESELHRAPRMFSLAQAPLLNNANELHANDTTKMDERPMEKIAKGNDSKEMDVQS